jgi:signal peptidase
MNEENLCDKLGIMIRLIPIALLVVLVVYSLLMLFDLHTPILIATGMSMSPTINAGDVLILDKPDILLIDEDDIIAYRGNDSIIVHRVIEVRDGYLITKGDNNQSSDTPVSKEDYVGRVVYTIPRIGLPLLLLSNPLLLSMLVISVVLALLFMYYDRRERLYSSR